MYLQQDYRSSEIKAKKARWCTTILLLNSDLYDISVLEEVPGYYCSFTNIKQEQKPAVLIHLQKSVF